MLLGVYLSMRYSINGNSIIYLAKLVMTSSHYDTLQYLSKNLKLEGKVKLKSNA